MYRAALRLAPLLLIATPLWAQQAHDHGNSPYVGMETRAVKALSEADIQSLLAGEGMSLALAAELNGYPGPRHVLEMAEALGLEPDQREVTERVMSDMLAEAQELGARIVAAERALDEAFSSGTVSEEGVREAVAELADLQGQLRAAHLVAHIAMMEVLTTHQVHRYSELRGYGSQHGGGPS